MPPAQIEHIGIAVNSLDKSVPTFERLLGVSCYRIEEVAEQEVRTAFFQIGGAKIELLESTSGDGPVGKFIANRGEGVHHIALVVEDLVGALEELKDAGVQLVDTEPRRGAEGSTMAFVHPRSTHGVLLELCQRPL
jgi:methylmalonyl-CoA/ethylmalonyl-CoA epimerase